MWARVYKIDYCHDRPWHSLHAHFWRFRVYATTAHWERGGVKHGPQMWPWWRLVSFRGFRLVGWEGAFLTYRLWAYTRWGALLADFSIDNRPPLADREAHH